MRVLTVRQPWAWAIIHGGKDVENRSRNIAGTYRGPVAIHAGLTADLEALASADFVGPIALTKMFRPRAEWFSNSPRGHIIGVVDLVDVHHALDVGPDSDLEQMCSPWAMEGHQHLVLANPRALATPIPAKGRLGLWKPDEALASAINAALDGDNRG